LPASTDSHAVDTRQAWQTLASTSSSADVLDSLDASLRPEGLDAAWWERFLEFRLKKVQSEARLKDESAKLALMRKELETSEAEDERLGSAVAAVMAQYTDFRNRRKQLMYDVDMQLHLKLGQVGAFVGWGSCQGGATWWCGGLHNRILMMTMMMPHLLLRMLLLLLLARDVADVVAVKLAPFGGSCSSVASSAVPTLLPALLHYADMTANKNLGAVVL
jgi:hypothetical protein